MLGLNGLTNTQRLIFGIILLLTVDVIWVASSELTEYIFKDADFDKPFFSTYLKISLFNLYLFGFLCRPSWWQQCSKKKNGNSEDEQYDHIGKSVYVPIKFDSRKMSGTESDESCDLSRSVSFSSVSEVRQLSDELADDANLSRLSYPAYLQAEEQRVQLANSLTVKQVAKLALVFAAVFFIGNLSYQEALHSTEAGIVNVLSSTCGLFTLLLGAMFPSGAVDRFTLSKLTAVLLSISGIVMVSFADQKLEHSKIPLGAVMALAGALCYAVYLVLLRRKVDNEDKLNIPMFFGFVGFFTLILFWPGFFILDFSKVEGFDWPTRKQWIYLIINGVVGTVLSELLWLWGCFLTSSLVGTLSLSLTIPLTMAADVVLKKVHYTWLFYVGSIPVLLAFLGVTLLTHYDTSDPVLHYFKLCLHFITGRRRLKRTQTRDGTEQSERLISAEDA